MREPRASWAILLRPQIGFMSARGAFPHDFAFRVPPHLTSHEHSDPAIAGLKQSLL